MISTTSFCQSESLCAEAKFAVTTAVEVMWRDVASLRIHRKWKYFISGSSATLRKQYLQHGAFGFDVQRAIRVFADSRSLGPAVFPNFESLTHQFSSSAFIFRMFSNKRVPVHLGRVFLSRIQRTTIVRSHTSVQRRPLGFVSVST